MIKLQTDAPFFLTRGSVSSSRVLCGRNMSLAKPVNVRIYDGEGAGPRSVQSARETLSESFVEGVQVSTISTKELLSGGWQQFCRLLVFPGGADLPYCKHLNGRGNDLIKEYVNGGGSYLGLCAGAYYACARVEFEVGSTLEVIGDRELAFFPGTARGSVSPGFQYDSEVGARSTNIEFLWPATHSFLKDAPSANLSLELSCQPNLKDGSLKDDEISSLEGVEPLWSSCADYMNGAPVFVGCDGDIGVKQNFRVIARYKDFGSSPAAVRCDVGNGVAVLCGTHPELDPHWLMNSGSTDVDVLHLVESLQKSHQSRVQFWNRLLIDAKCGPWLQL